MYTSWMGLTSFLKDVCKACSACIAVLGMGCVCVAYHVSRQGGSVCIACCICCALIRECHMDVQRCEQHAPVPDLRSDTKWPHQRDLQGLKDGMGVEVLSHSCLHGVQGYCFILFCFLVTLASMPAHSVIAGVAKDTSLAACLLYLLPRGIAPHNSIAPQQYQSTCAVWAAGQQTLRSLQ